MSDLSSGPLGLNGTNPDERWQSQLLAVARALPYPATPELAPAVLRRMQIVVRRRPARSAAFPAARVVGGRRMGWAVAAVVILVLAGGLLAVPGVRAGVLEFLQIGVVRIELVATATPTPAGSVTSGPGTQASAATRTALPTVTLRPRPTPLSSILDLEGQTTFADAQARAPFALRLPTYPADLGQPDLAFVQDLDGTAVVLIWLEPADPTQVRLSVQYLSSRDMATKLIYEVVKETPGAVEFTEVNGREAIWTTGPYVLRTQNGQYVEYRLIQGHVLIWTDGNLTYRLETNLARDEAVRIAESLEE